MFQVTISGKTKAELLASASDLIALLGDAKTAPLTATEQSRLRADATVVPPKQPTAAEKKAAKAAAEKAAAEAAAAE